jgi:hypothetical protein
MTLKDATDNLLVDINSYQLISIVAARVKDGNDISYSIGVAMINDKYIFRVEADEYLIVHDYQMSSAEKAKCKLQWILNKYSLTVTSIIYFKNVQTNELLAKYYKEKLLSYTIETKRITRKELLINYTTITHPIIYRDFVRNFDDITELVKTSCRKYDIELILQQEHPLQMVRRLKLVDIDLNEN